MRIRTGIPAYMTVYLSLTLGVLVSLWVVLMEGARLGAIQLKTACLADSCTDSVLAEYHRELFKRYNILAVDSSYGTGYVGRTNVEGRLVYYLDQNLPGNKPEGYLKGLPVKDFLGLRIAGADVTEYTLLSDEQGSVFEYLASEAVRSDLGLGIVQEVIALTQSVQQYQLDTRDVEAEKRAVDAKIASYQGKEIEKNKKLEFESPTAIVDRQDKSILLWQTLGSQHVSTKRINRYSLISQRMKKRENMVGTLVYGDNTRQEKLFQRALFGEFVLSYMGNFREPRKDDILDYEAEYVLMGRESDAENLSAVLYRILAMREAANALYLFSDKTKSEEARLVGLALSTILGVPELEELFQATILFTWAYVESLYDLRVLLSGGRVVLFKSEKTWHYSLGNMLAGLFDTKGDGSQNDGMSYQDYLRVLLLLAKEEDVSCRAMDIVEGNIRLTPGNSNFRMDGCFVKLKAKVSMASRYGYEAEVWEEKKY